MGQYALVTGAAGGIGQALCKKFSGAGFIVIATDIIDQPDRLNCDYYLQVDIAKTSINKQYADQVFTDIQKIVSPHGLHVLINNAAIQILSSTDSLSREDWQQTFNVNLSAPFFWIQGLLAELEKTGKGSIINISSIHAKLTKKNFVAYATSKAALSGMTKALAVDLGSRVRINCIEPAAIETDMLKAGFIGKDDLYKDLKEFHPQQRIGTPEEVSALALVMSDSEVSFLHGSVIGLDGGIAGKLFDPD